MADVSLPLTELVSWQELVKAQKVLLHDAIAAINGVLPSLADQVDHDADMKEKELHVQYLISDLKEKTSSRAILQREVDHQR